MKITVQGGFIPNALCDLGAVELEVAPVHVVVVDETAVEDESAVGSQGARDDVGGVGVCSTVGGGPHASFGIGFDEEAREIRDGAIQLIGRVLPP